MRNKLRPIWLLAILATVAIVLPAAAQTLITTVPVGQVPNYPIFNPVTNKIYIENILQNPSHVQ